MLFDRGMVIQGAAQNYEMIYYLAFKNKESHPYETKHNTFK